ncbi:MAG TPA: helix-turn-helix domain-containing protein [Ktedonobacterales bacterium]
MSRNSQAATGAASALPLLLRVDQVAEQIGVHPATVWAMVGRKEINAVRISPRVTRVPLVDLQAYIARLRTEQIGDSGNAAPPAA